jgi:hypothetical protein
MRLKQKASALFDIINLRQACAAVVNASSNPISNPRADGSVD